MKRLVISILFYCLVFTEAFSLTIRVGPSESVKSIKAAIAKASPGDTLLIQPGTYREGNILLEKSINLIGINYPILDGENRYEILTIHASNLVIQGLKFINTGVASLHDLSAISVDGSKEVLILDNRLENSFFGVHFTNSSDSKVEGNELQARGLTQADHEIGNGIHLWKCNGITVSNNKIKGHRDGIYFEFVTNSFITGNTSEGNMRYGLHFMFSHNNEYRSNIFSNNGAGVAVMYTKGVKMIGNTFDHNWGDTSYGLLLKDISDSEVRNNRFIKNSIGILMEGSSRISFSENIFSENGFAVRIQASCDDNVFARNNFFGNTFDMATNGSLVLNTIDGNYWDHYEGYDLDKNGIGDVPFRPVSLFSMVMEKIPTSVLLWRSFFVYLLDRAEKAIPVVTPENLKDNSPSMKPYDYIQGSK